MCMNLSKFIEGEKGNVMGMKNHNCSILKWTKKTWKGNATYKLWLDLGLNKLTTQFIFETTGKLEYGLDIKKLSLSSDLCDNSFVVM